MNKDQYLDAFHRRRAGILQAAELGLDEPVFACPGWDVAALAGHVGGVYTFWTKWVRERPRGSDDEAFRELTAEREAKLPGYGAWRESGFVKDARPSGIIDFARETGDELELRLRGLDPSDHVWTFVPSKQTAGFIQRRITHETSIHLWDAQAALGREEPIPAELARDGIDEYMTGILFIDFDDHARKSRHTGQRFLFSEMDGVTRWLVTFAPDGISANPEWGEADVSISGSASDLNLFLLGRVPARALEVQGDRSLADQWKEFAGTF